MTIQLIPPRFGCILGTASPEHCFGVISEADWLLIRENRLDAPHSTASLPVTCSFQARCRMADGTEKTLCTLPEGACSVQAKATDTDGGKLITCSEPTCVLVDWQVVEVERSPEEGPHYFVIVDPGLASSAPALPELSQKMIDSHIHHLHIVNRELSLISVVSRTDVLTAAVHKETK